MITYSTSSPVMPAFCRAAEMAIPPRSTAGMSLREPDNLPIGVLAPPTMTDPGIVRLLLSFRPVKIRDRRVHVVPHQIPPRRSRAAVAGRQRRHPHHRLVGKCRTAARIALDVERGCWSSPVRRWPHQAADRRPLLLRGSRLRQKLSPPSMVGSDGRAA